MCTCHTLHKTVKLSLYRRPRKTNAKKKLREMPHLPSILACIGSISTIHILNLKCLAGAMAASSSPLLTTKTQSGGPTIFVNGNGDEVIFHGIGW